MANLRGVQITINVLMEDGETSYAINTPNLVEDGEIIDLVKAAQLAAEIMPEAFKQLEDSIRDKFYKTLHKRFTNRDFKRRKKGKYDKE